MLSDTPLSKSSHKTKARALELWEVMRLSTPERTERWPRVWEHTTAEEACVPEMFDHFANFLVNEHDSETAQSEDGFLSYNTALGYFNALLRISYDRWHATASPEHKYFWTCMDKNASTDEAKWLAKVRGLIWKICFQRAMGDPDGMDKSVPPMYRSHLDKIDTAYAKEGTLEVSLTPMPKTSPRPTLHACCKSLLLAPPTRH